jgi:aquaporin Z
LASVGANVPNTAIGMTSGGAFLLETILSFIMMVTILLCGDAEGGIFDGGAIRVGAIVGLEVMLFGPISGAAMSPARAFGPYLASGDWSTFWVYVAGPFAGIMAAAIVWRRGEAWRGSKLVLDAKRSSNKIRG